MVGETRGRKREDEEKKEGKKEEKKKGKKEEKDQGYSLFGVTKYGYIVILVHKLYTKFL